MIWDIWTWKNEKQASPSYSGVKIQKLSCEFENWENDNSTTKGRVKNAFTMSCHSCHSLDAIMFENF